MQITLEIATKVRDTVAAGLVKGAGNPVPGQMCVEAAVCYALGLPHGDDPQCVARSLRSLKIAINDAQWSSPQARAHGLRKLALLQLGSAGAMDDRGFARRVALMTIRTMLPVALRAVAKKVRFMGLRINHKNILTCYPLMPHTFLLVLSLSFQGAIL